MITAITTALSGLNRSSKQIEESAKSIASSPDQGRIIEDVIDIKVSEIAYKANLKTIQIASDMSDELLKILDRKV